VTSFAEIAAAEGIDERTVRRIVATVLRRMADETDASDPEELLRALIGGLRANYFSTENETISRIPRRFCRDLGSESVCAERVGPRPVSLSSQRARHPFRRSKP
jgi:hypothetical protein